MKFNVFVNLNPHNERAQSAGMTGCRAGRECSGSSDVVLSCSSQGQPSRRMGSSFRCFLIFAPLGSWIVVPKEKVATLLRLQGMLRVSLSQVFSSPVRRGLWRMPASASVYSKLWPLPNNSWSLGYNLQKAFKMYLFIFLCLLKSLLVFHFISHRAATHLDQIVAFSPGCFHACPCLCSPIAIEGWGQEENNLGAGLLIFSHAFCSCHLWGQ